MKIINPLVSKLIYVQEVIRTKTWTVTADPFRWFQTNEQWTSFINQMTQLEKNMFPETVSSILRQSLVNLPGVGLPGFESNVETQIITNRSSGATISDYMRERDRESISLLTLIWFPVMFIVFDIDIRTSFINNVTGALSVPTLLVEFFKKVRLSRLGTNFIRFKLDKESCKEFIRRNPGYKNTFLDIDFMSTQTGQRRWLEFTSFLNTLEGNYVAFSPMSELQKIELSSGNTTTFLALTIEKFSTIQNAVINLLPQNSFGENIDAVHIVDALALALTHTIDGKAFDCEDIVSGFTINADLLSLAHHVSERVSGRQPNPRKYKGKSNLSDSEASEPTESPPKDQKPYDSKSSKTEITTLSSGKPVRRPASNRLKYDSTGLFKLFKQFLAYLDYDTKTLNNKYVTRFSYS